MMCNGNMLDVFYAHRLHTKYIYSNKQHLSGPTSLSLVLLFLLMLGVLFGLLFA